MVGRTTTAIQPTRTGATKVDSARDIVLVRSKILNNSAITPKRGLNLYRLNSAKNTTTIRPVTSSAIRTRHRAKRRSNFQYPSQVRFAYNLFVSIPCRAADYRTFELKDAQVRGSDRRDNAEKREKRSCIIHYPMSGSRGL